MTFPAKVEADLAGPLNRAHVMAPAPGKYGEYIQGWKTIEEANRIFSHGGWNRETVEMVEVCRDQAKIGRNNDPGWAVGYRAKVRVTILDENGIGKVVREGSAVGSGEARKLYDAIESAVKEAETDAMKRALMTLGNPLGLALYDKSKANVQDAPPPTITEEQRTELVALFEATGTNPKPYMDRAAANAGVVVNDLRDLPAAEFTPLSTHLKSKPQKEAA